MKRIYFTIFFILLILSSYLNAEYFNIQDYNVNVKIANDSSAKFEETILVKFFTPRHGIYRFIPYKYSKKKFHIKVLKVEKSFNGTAYSDEKFIVKRKKGFIIIRVGSRNRRYQGLIYYKIIYKVFDAVSNNEFYWNVIGFKWPVYIRSANIALEFPEVDDLDSLVCNVKSTDAILDYNLTNHLLTLKEPVSLPPYQGITVSILFPENLIHNVPFYRKILWFLYDYSGYIIALLVFIIMFFVWKAWGKDEPKGPIVVKYNPPKGLTPAEVGILIDDKIDLKDITATILDLGAKGYIKIEKDADNLIFRKLKAPDENLKSHEKAVLSGLFPLNRDKSSIKELKGDFYITVELFEKMLNYLSDKSHLYTVNPEKIRSTFKFISYFFIIAGICSGFLGYKIDICIGLIISGLIILFYSRIMPQKTHKGAKLYREILGFKEFIERVDKDRLKRFAEKDPEIFGRLLPYAVALGLEEKWVKKFEGINIEPPSYYYVPYGGHGFVANLFLYSLINDLNSVNSILTPSDNIDGFNIGSGGGFSGGGSFGGGFGGGGGGSW